MGEPEAFATGMNFRHKGDNLSASASSMLKLGFKSRNYGSLPQAANFFLNQSQHLNCPDHSSYSRYTKKLLSRSDAALTNMSLSSNLHSDLNRVSGNSSCHRRFSSPFFPFICMNFFSPVFYFSFIVLLTKVCLFLKWFLLRLS